MLDRMHELERRHLADQVDGTPFAQRLRQVPPETGRLLALMAALAPAGQMLEIGTSGGYSGMWLSLACRERGDRLVTFELAEDKVLLAGETFRLAGVQEWVQIVHGNALDYLEKYPAVAFCFLDTNRALYDAIYAALVPNLVPGGLLLVDNAISHASELAAFIQRAEQDPQLDSLILPVGKGVLVCRKKR
jgi:predicted O-methyltransferase YrrM